MKMKWLIAFSLFIIERIRQKWQTLKCQKWQACQKWQIGANT